MKQLIIRAKFHSQVIRLRLAGLLCLAVFIPTIPALLVLDRICANASAIDILLDGIQVTFERFLSPIVRRCTELENEMKQ